MLKLVSVMKCNVLMPMFGSGMLLFFVWPFPLFYSSIVLHSLGTFLWLFNSVFSVGDMARFLEVFLGLLGLF